MALASGHAGFYLAVPVEAHHFSGEVSKMESRSAIVGLVDAQELVAQADTGRTLAALRLSDGPTSLATIGSPHQHIVRTSLDAGGRPWTLSVDGGALSTFEQALPWLVLVFGLGLTLAVGLSLRNSRQRRDAALRLARDRSEELSGHAQARRANEPRPGAGPRRGRPAVAGRPADRHLQPATPRRGPLGRAGAPGGGSAAVLLLDLDHFKSVNDRYGHRTGDSVLQAAAARIASITRTADCLARWGGEEFAILAPGIGRDGAIRLAERARAALADQPVQVDDASIELTLSVGVAVAGSEAQTPDQLVDAADEALYEAKRAGRNCIRVFQRKGAVDVPSPAV